MDRTERFYKIQKMLTEKQSVTAEQFMNALEISRATFRRDLEYLRDRLGAPIDWDSDLRAYVLKQIPGENGIKSLPGLWLNEREIHGLLSVIELLKNIEPEGLVGAHLQPIRERLEKMLEHGEFTAKEISRRIRVASLAKRITSSAFFQEIADALLKRKRLHIQHFGRQDGKVTQREVSPQRLVYYRDNWYLDAFCHERDDLRTFSLDAIEAVQALDKDAVSVEESVLTEELESGYGIFAGKKHHIAKLKFSPFRSRWVAKEQWHPNQKGRLLEDGSYLLEVPYSDETELTLDILRQGPEVEVLSPSALRTNVAQVLKRSAALYETTN